MTEGPYQPLERRPIKARNLRVMQRLADRLAQLGVSPNGISVAGMFCGILAGISFGATAAFSQGALPLPLGRFFFLGAALGIQLRLLANLLDGMVAIAAGKASPVGELYNDVPDRVSDAATLIGAGYAAGGGDPVLGYAAASVALFTAYVRAVGKAAGAAQEYCGPMAKQQRMFILTVLAIYCALAPANWQPAWGENGNWGLISAGLLVIMAGGVVTALRRLRRIAAQLRNKSP